MSTVTMQELELETAELLPGRETLCVPKYSPCHGSSGVTITQVERKRERQRRRQRRRRAPRRHPERQRRRQPERQQHRHCPVAARARTTACCAVPEGAARQVRRAALSAGRPSSYFRGQLVSMQTREEQARDRSGRARDRRAAGPALRPADAPGPVQVPRLAEGVELLGEYQGSGYSQPPSLVRRADGQVIQMSALLYRVACRIDGSRDPAAIAELVSEDLGRSLTADQVRYLITPSCCPWASSPARALRPSRRGPIRCSRCGRGARCCPSGRRTPPPRC